MLKVPDYQTLDITVGLGRYGYDLRLTDKTRAELKRVEEGTEKPLKQFGIEEIVVTILAENPDPEYIGGIPVILAKNPVDYGALVERAKEMGAVKKLGWILSVAKQCYEKMGIRYGHALDDAIERCRPAKDAPEEIIDPALGNPAYIRMAVERREPIAAEWGILTLYFNQGFEKKLDTYVVRDGQYAGRQKRAA
ncbi:hypothetical protein HY638_03495 [Candidatus Woesearchaeota archaeon]|nr:hypothetical protein [Candidatus Woesearchaeota archaeon]